MRIDPVVPVPAALAGPSLAVRIVLLVLLLPSEFIDPFSIDCSTRGVLRSSSITSVLDRETLSTSAYSHAQPKSVMNCDVSCRNQGKIGATGNNPSASVLVKSGMSGCPPFTMRRKNLARELSIPNHQRTMPFNGIGAPAKEVGKRSVCRVVLHSEEIQGTVIALEGLV